MWRLILPLLILGALLALVPLLARSDAGGETLLQTDLSDPEATVDVDLLRSRSQSRVLRLATDEELHTLRAATVSALVQMVEAGAPRERRLAAAVLGATGESDFVPVLVRSFEEEKDPRTLPSLAVALAESQRMAAVAALVRAIRERPGLPAYEASRALKTVFGVNFGLDADAWERWIETTRATRE